jgi:septal ring factor EnvC (AmiA/AmiB activator)
MGRVRGGKYLLTLITGMLVGLLIGIIVINTLISYRIDQYHQRIKYLEKAIEDEKTKFKKLEESINKRKFIIKDIEVMLIYEGDELEKIELDKHIKGKYSNLLGKEVKTIDADMTSDIIDGRIMQIGDKEYKLKVNKLVITEVLKIWVKIDVNP